MVHQIIYRVAKPHMHVIATLISGSERRERARRETSHEPCTVLGLEGQNCSDRLVSGRHSHHSSTNAAVEAVVGDQPCNSYSLSAEGSGTHRLQQRNEETRNNPGRFVRDVYISCS